MKLYLLRHATASEIASNDDRRELTQEGWEEARIAGEALVKLGAKPTVILSSPLVRAHQTAQMAAKALKLSKRIELAEELKNGASTASLLKELKSRASDSEIVLVGHMPSLAEHLAVFIGAESAHGLPLGKGSVACIEMESVRLGTGQLRWLMRQKQLREVTD